MFCQCNHASLKCCRGRSTKVQDENIYYLGVIMTGTGIGADCGQWSRHRHVYEATVRPGGRNIVLLFDLGEALTPRLLLTAKTVGEFESYIGS